MFCCSLKLGVLRVSVTSTSTESSISITSILVSGDNFDPEPSTFHSQAYKLSYFSLALLWQNEHLFFCDSLFIFKVICLQVFKTFTMIVIISIKRTTFWCIICFSTLPFVVMVNITSQSVFKTSIVTFSSSTLGVKNLPNSQSLIWQLKITL